MFHNIKVSMEVSVDEEEFADVLLCWYPNSPFEFEEESFPTKVFDHESGKEYTLTLQMALEALSEFLTGTHDCAMATAAGCLETAGGDVLFDPVGFDSVCAYIVTQLALFGEVIYG